MITLGIECSSRQGSVALLKDGELLGQKTWIAERIRHNTIFQTLENLIAGADVSYNDISLYAVGRGPGSFSGMRMSFAIAQALALPTQTEVRAVSSGAALALAAARDGAKEIAVVGDARRGQVWIGFFHSTSGRGAGAERQQRNEVKWQTLENSKSKFPNLGKIGLKVSKDWKLTPYEEVDVPEKTAVVSPEAERLKEIFPLDRRERGWSGATATERSEVAHLGKPQFPHAKEVVELALLQVEPEPLEPLYMHPPVFIEPKYA